MKEGEAVANLAMTIARGGVITGVVRDIGGRPVPGVNVRVLKLGYNAVTGERTLGAPSTGSVGLTDDRGEYRAYGLPPGGYLVVVVPSVPSGRGNVDIRQLTSAEVRQALQAARAGASTAPVKPGQPTLPPASSPGAARVNYAPIFHPGVTDIGAAATIALGVSEERTGVGRHDSTRADGDHLGHDQLAVRCAFPSPSRCGSCLPGRRPKCSREPACAACPRNPSRRHLRVHRRRAGRVHGQSDHRSWTVAARAHAQHADAVGRG